VRGRGRRWICGGEKGVEVEGTLLFLRRGESLEGGWTPGRRALLKEGKTKRRGYGVCLGDVGLGEVENCYGVWMILT
jgi:hypothetical protein